MHCVQDVDPEVEELPASHGEQFTDAEAELNLPAEHGIHVSLPVTSA